MLSLCHEGCVHPERVLDQWYWTHSSWPTTESMTVFHWYACWAKVAARYRPAAAVGGNPQLPVVHITLEASVSDKIFAIRIWSWLSDDLPLLQERTGPATTAYTNALTALMQEFQLKRQEDTARAAVAVAPKTPTERFPGHIHCWQRVCKVQTADQLPALYTTLPMVSKAGCNQAVQSLVNAQVVAFGVANIVRIVRLALFE